MNFTQYLKLQLIDFIDTYKKFYSKTLGATILFALITFALIGLLLQFSIFDKTNSKRHISLISYFITRYSTGDTYSIVDFSKTTFIFIVSIFSISLARLKKEEPVVEGFKFSDFLKQIMLKDFGYFTLALIICIISDYTLVKVDEFSAINSGDSRSGKWIHNILFLLRLYIPLIIFSFTNYQILIGGKIKFGFKKIIFLFITLWLFNEFAYEILIFMRSYLFELVLIPFPDDKYYIFESLLSVPIISFFFLGYHSAMTNSMRLLNENKNADISN